MRTFDDFIKIKESNLRDIAAQLNARAKELSNKQVIKQPMQQPNEIVSAFIQAKRDRENPERFEQMAKPYLDSYIAAVNSISPEKVNSILKVLTEWRRDHPIRPISLPELFRQVSQYMTKEQMMGICLNLFREKKISLGEWTQNAFGLDPNFILPVGKELRYYVELR